MAFTEHVSKSYVDGKLAQKASAESLNAEVAARESLSSRVDEHVRDTYPKAVVDEKIAAAKPSDYETLKGRVSDVEGKIPSQASSSNQLADKAFVNSSVATETATFRGTFNLVTDLELPLNATHEQVAAAVKTELGQTDYDGNDYVFVQIPQDLEHTDAMKQVDRYKCVETGADPVVKSWEYEWTLNNSSFTAAQWAAINSGITAGKIDELRDKLDLAVYERTWTPGDPTGGGEGTKFTLSGYGFDNPLEFPWDAATSKWKAVGPDNVYISKTATGFHCDSIPYVFAEGFDFSLGAEHTYNIVDDYRLNTITGYTGSLVAGSDTLAKKSEIPSVPVASVNGKTGEVTLTGADIAVSSTDATKIDAALAGNATKDDATLEEASYEYGAWVAVASDGHDYAVVYSEPDGNWYLDCDSGTGPLAHEEYSPTATEITFGPYPMHGGEYDLTATATRTATPTSYRLGPDSATNPNRDKPLASEAEVEALRTAVAAKQNALSQTQLANIAAVSDALAFDATHTYSAGDPVVYDGTLYTFTSAHTGAWTGSDVSAVDIIARLAALHTGKADRVADPADGNLASLDENGNLKDSSYKAADFVEKRATNILIGSGASKVNNVTNAVVIGVNASANGSTTSSAVAIGTEAKAKKTGAIQLGAGENSEEKSLQFRGTRVVGGDGKIPTSSLRDFPALESVPDRAIAASTAYAVGDVLGDGGKAYRCKLAYTSAANPVSPSSDTTHWAEVPVLKATDERLAGMRGKLDLNVYEEVLAGWAFTARPEGSVNPYSSLFPEWDGSSGRWMLYEGGTLVGMSGASTQEATDIVFLLMNYPQIQIHAVYSEGGITQTGYTLALTAGTGYTGNLAALDADGNPTDAGWTAGDIARYALTTKTIDNGAVTLDDRALNAVAISSSLASLTINFPSATSGKARDFGLRLTVASGVTTAPQIVLPQGVTCENADGEAPEIGADGAATILYFTETASGVFLVKGEVLQTITQA